MPPAALTAATLAAPTLLNIPEALLKTARILSEATIAALQSALLAALLWLILAGPGFLT